MIYTPELGIKKGRFKDNVLEIAFEEEPEPPVIKEVKKKRYKAGKSISRSPPHTSESKHRSLEIKTQFKSQVYPKKVEYHKLPTRTVVPNKRLENIKKYQARPKQHSVMTPIQEGKEPPRRTYVPHSAVYMHRINQRGLTVLRSRLPHSHHRNSQHLSSSHHQEVREFGDGSQIEEAGMP